ncbi:YrhB domain-containing protein [Flavobacterium hungaricum]|nr:YrhB domain-containing protein [Flavobacterium hungaricum]
MTDRLEKNSSFFDEDSLIILDEYTIEKPYGWIFSYTYKLLHETQNPKYLIAGNVPIIVSRKDGQEIPCSPYDEIGQEFEEDEKIWNLVLTPDIPLDNAKLIALKNKLNLSLNTLKEIKENPAYLLDSGSEFRLKSLQSELQNIGVETKLFFSWEN